MIKFAVFMIEEKYMYNIIELNNNNIPISYGFDFKIITDDFETFEPYCDEKVSISMFKDNSFYKYIFYPKHENTILWCNITINQLKKINSPVLFIRKNENTIDSTLYEIYNFIQQKLCEYYNNK